MSFIKAKERVNNIKVLDKAAVVSEHIKTAFVRSKDQAQNLLDDGQVTPSEYAEDKIKYMAEDTVYDIGHAVRKGTGKAVNKGLKIFREHRQEQHTQDAAYNSEQTARQSTTETAQQTRHFVRAKGRNIKTAQKTEHTVRQSAKSTGKASVKSAKATVKATEKGIKTAEATSKAAVKTAEVTAKTAQKTAEASAKAAQKAAEVARQTAIAAYKASVAAAKAIAAAIKAIVEAIKELIAAIAEGGWIAVVIIVIICLVAFLVCSCFGIFFSNEDTGCSQTMQQVVQEINIDYQEQLDLIKNSVSYDELEISGSQALWSEVLSIYAVKTTTDPINPQEVATITDEKKQLLKDIFWEMNEISYHTETKTETVIIETNVQDKNTINKEVKKTNVYLYITINHKTADEMAIKYNFDANQKLQLNELLSDKNNGIWLTLLYGTYSGNDQIVLVALSQIGNIGGEPYWSWYGFSHRVEWCACFVSWCADQCGYIETGVYPKYSGCGTGVKWFKERGLWADNSIEPTPGMIIFFDWAYDGLDGGADHTGIVERVENGIIYTIEGNSGNKCVEGHYNIGYYEILGYGIPAN